AAGSFGLLSAAHGSQAGWRRHAPPALFLLAIGCLLLGLARPQAAMSLPRLEGTVVLAFDVSRSMGAADAKPTRLEVAKAAARAFVERQPSTVKIAVVAFSDGGLAVQAPTNDQAEIVAAIERLAPEQGTSVGAGLRAALQTIAVSEGLVSDDPAATPTPIPLPGQAPALPRTDAATIVMFSDGENMGDPDPAEVARDAAERGIPIHTVGVGTAAGATIESNGFTLSTRLDEAALEQIAAISGGSAYSAATPDELSAVYDSIERQLVTTPELTEITAIFAGAGLLALLAGGLCSLIWFGRVP
ncbi:MAG TPA: VWA domain-containing protein, partial [Herpetosiphonaceae bacterium]